MIFIKIYDLYDRLQTTILKSLIVCEMGLHWLRVQMSCSMFKAGKCYYKQIQIELTGDWSLQGWSCESCNLNPLLAWAISLALFMMFCDIPCGQFWEQSWKKHWHPSPWENWWSIYHSNFSQELNQWFLQSNSLIITAMALLSKIILERRFPFIFQLPIWSSIWW